MTQEILDLCDIRPMPEELATLPILTMRCVLKGFEEVETSEKHSVPHAPFCPSIHLKADLDNCRKRPESFGKSLICLLSIMYD
jgi:hypothetical protein